MARELAVAYIPIVPSMGGFKKKLTAELNKSVPKSFSGGGGIGASLSNNITGGLKKSLKWGIVGAMGAAGAAGGLALKKGFDRAKALEDAQAKLKATGYGVQEIEKISKNALSAVKGTAYGLGDAMTTASTAMAYGIKPGKELESYLTKIGDAAAFSGRSYTDMGQIFGKVMGKGKAQAEELNMMTESGIPIIKYLAEEMGVAQGEVYELASKGQVSADIFLRAMGKLDGVAAEMGKTTTGALMNLTAALGRMGEKVIAGVYPLAAPLFMWLTGVVDGVTARLEFLPGFLEGIISDFKTGFTLDWEAFSPDDLEGPWQRFGYQAQWNLHLAKFYWGEFVGALRGDDPGYIIDRTQGAMVALGSGIRRLGEASQVGFAALGAGWRGEVEPISNHPIAGWLQWFGRQWSATFSAMASSLTDGRLSGALQGIFGSLGPILDAVAAGLGYFSATLGSVASTLISTGLVVLAEGLVLALQAMSGVLGFVSQHMAIFGPLISTAAFALAAYGTAMRLAALYTGAMTVVQSIAGFMRRLTLATVAQTVAQRALHLAMAMNPIGLVIAGIAALAAGLTWFFTKTETGRQAWSSLMGAFRSAWSWLSGVFGAGIQRLSAEWSRFGEDLARVGTGFRERVIQPIVTGFNWLKGALGSAWSWLKTAVVDAMVFAWNRIKATFHSMVNAFMSSTTVWKAILGAAWAWIKTYFVDRVSNGWQRMLIAFRVVATGIGVVFRTLGAALAATWAWIKTNVVDRFIQGFRFLKSVFDRIASGIRFGWNVLKDALAAGWHFIRAQVFDRMKLGLSWLRDRFNAVTGAIRGAWNWLRDRLWDGWEYIRFHVFERMKQGLGFLRAAFRAAKDVIRDQWNTLRDNLRGGWNFIRDRVFNPLKKFITETIPNAFQSGKDAVKRIWDGIKDVAKKPVKFVIETVINKGILKGVRAIANMVGLKDKVPGDVKLPEGFARGGVLPGYQRRKKDDILTPMRSGEGVLVPEAVSALGKDFIYGINAAANSGGVGGAKRWAQENQRPLTADDLKRDSRGRHHERSAGGAIPRAIWGSEQSRMAATGKMRVPNVTVSGVNLGQAAKAWIGRSGLDISTGNGGPGVRRGTAQRSGHIPGWAYGHYTTDGTVYIKPGMEKRLALGVAVHELGHALSLGHPVGGYVGSSIMGGGFMRSPQPTAADYSVLRSVWGQPGAGAKTYNVDDGQSGLAMLAELALKPFEWVVGSAKKLISGVAGAGLWGELATGSVDWVWGIFKDFVTRKEGESSGEARPAEQWAPTVRTALRRVGLPTGDDYVGAWLRQIQSESSGNPRAVQQITDINGTGLSGGAGLVQVIPSTFRAYRDPSLPDDRFHPLANLVAGMRYAMSRYGTAGMLRVIGKGHGYARGGIVGERPYLHDQGGVLHPGVSLIQNKTRKPEAILNPSQMTAWMKNTELVDALVTQGDTLTSSEDVVALLRAIDGHLQAGTVVQIDGREVFRATKKYEQRARL